MADATVMEQLNLLVREYVEGSTMELMVMSDHQRQTTLSFLQLSLAGKSTFTVNQGRLARLTARVISSYNRKPVSLEDESNKILRVADADSQLDSGTEKFREQISFLNASKFKKDDRPKETETTNPLPPLTSLLVHSEGEFSTALRPLFWRGPNNAERIPQDVVRPSSTSAFPSTSLSSDLDQNLEVASTATEPHVGIIEKSGVEGLKPRTDGPTAFSALPPQLFVQIPPVMPDPGFGWTGRSSSSEFIVPPHALLSAADAVLALNNGKFLPLKPEFVQNHEHLHKFQCKKFEGPAGFSDSAKKLRMKQEQPVDNIVDRANQEIHVLSRITDLRKLGLWSAKRMPKIVLPDRPKSCWDFVVEEAAYMQNDFHLERREKVYAACRIALAVKQYWAKRCSTTERRRQSELEALQRKTASAVAMLVANWWKHLVEDSRLGTTIDAADAPTSPSNNFSSTADVDMVPVDDSTVEAALPATNPDLNKQADISESHPSDTLMPYDRELRAAENDDSSRMVMPMKLSAHRKPPLTAVERLCRKIVSRSADWNSSSTVLPPISSDVVHADDSKITSQNEALSVATMQSTATDAVDHPATVAEAVDESMKSIIDTVSHTEDAVTAVLVSSPSGAEKIDQAVAVHDKDVEKVPDLNTQQGDRLRNDFDNNTSLLFDSALSSSDTEPAFELENDDVELRQIMQRHGTYGLVARFADFRSFLDQFNANNNTAEAARCVLPVMCPSFALTQDLPPTSPEQSSLYPNNKLLLAPPALVESAVVRKKRGLVPHEVLPQYSDEIIGESDLPHITRAIVIPRKPSRAHLFAEPRAVDAALLSVSSSSQMNPASAAAKAGGGDGDVITGSDVFLGSPSAASTRDDQQDQQTNANVFDKKKQKGVRDAGQAKVDQPSLPKSVFDMRASPLSVVAAGGAASAASRDAAVAYQRMVQLRFLQPYSSMHARLSSSAAATQHYRQGADWSTEEDFLVAITLQGLQEIPFNNVNPYPAQQPNFDLAAFVVSTCTGRKRLSYHCQNRLFDYIIPFEEGKVSAASSNSRTVGGKGFSNDDAGAADNDNAGNSAKRRKAAVSRKSGKFQRILQAYQDERQRFLHAFAGGADAAAASTSNLASTTNRISSIVNQVLPQSRAAQRRPMLLSSSTDRIKRLNSKLHVLPAQLDVWRPQPQQQQVSMTPIDIVNNVLRSRCSQMEFNKPLMPSEIAEIRRRQGVLTDGVGLASMNHPQNQLQQQQPISQQQQYLAQSSQLSSSTNAANYVDGGSTARQQQQQQQLAATLQQPRARQATGHQPTMYYAAAPVGTMSGLGDLHQDSRRPEAQQQLTSSGTAAYYAPRPASGGSAAAPLSQQQLRFVHVSQQSQMPQQLSSSSSSAQQISRQQRSSLPLSTASNNTMPSGGLLRIMSTGGGSGTTTMLPVAVSYASVMGPQQQQMIPGQHQQNRFAPLAAAVQRVQYGFTSQNTRHSAPSSLPPGSAVRSLLMSSPSDRFAAIAQQHGQEVAFHPSSMQPQQQQQQMMMQHPQQTLHHGSSVIQQSATSLTQLLNSTSSANQHQQTSISSPNNQNTILVIPASAIRSGNLPVSLQQQQQQQTMPYLLNRHSSASPLQRPPTPSASPALSHALMPPSPGGSVNNNTATTNNMPQQQYAVHYGQYCAVPPQRQVQQPPSHNNVDNTMGGAMTSQALMWQQQQQQQSPKMIAVGGGQTVLAVAQQSQQQQQLPAFAPAGDRNESDTRPTVESTTSSSSASVSVPPLRQTNSAAALSSSPDENDPDKTRLVNLLLRNQHMPPAQYSKIRAKLYSRDIEELRKLAEKQIQKRNALTRAQQQQRQQAAGQQQSRSMQPPLIPEPSLHSATRTWVNSGGVAPQPQQLQQMQIPKSEVNSELVQQRSVQRPAYENEQSQLLVSTTTHQQLQQPSVSVAVDAGAMHSAGGAYSTGNVATYIPMPSSTGPSISTPQPNLSSRNVRAPPPHLAGGGLYVRAVQQQQQQLPPLGAAATTEQQQQSLPSNERQQALNVSSSAPQQQQQLTPTSQAPTQQMVIPPEKIAGMREAMRQKNVHMTDQQLIQLISKKLVRRPTTGTIVQMSGVGGGGALRVSNLTTTVASFMSPSGAGLMSNSNSFESSASGMTNKLVADDVAADPPPDLSSSSLSSPSLSSSNAPVYTMTSSGGSLTTLSAPFRDAALTASHLAASDPLPAASLQHLQLSTTNAAAPVSVMMKMPSGHQPLSSNEEPRSAAGQSNNKGGVATSAAEGRSVGPRAVLQNSQGTGLASTTYPSLSAANSATGDALPPLTNTNKANTSAGSVQQQQVAARARGGMASRRTVNTDTEPSQQITTTDAVFDAASGSLSELPIRTLLMTNNKAPGSGAPRSQAASRGSSARSAASSSTPSTVSLNSTTDSGNNTANTNSATTLRPTAGSTRKRLLSPSSSASSLGRVAIPSSIDAAGSTVRHTQQAKQVRLTKPANVTLSSGAPMQHVSALVANRRTAVSSVARASGVFGSQQLNVASKVPSLTKLTSHSHAPQNTPSNSASDVDINQKS